MRLLLIFFIFFTVYADAQINLPKSQFMQVSESKYRFNDSAVFNNNFGYKERSVRRYDSNLHIQTIAGYDQNNHLVFNLIFQFDKGYFIRKEERNDCDSVMQREIYVNDTLGRKIYSKVEYYILNPCVAPGIRGGVADNGYCTEFPTTTVVLYKYDSMGNCEATINRGKGSLPR